MVANPTRSPASTSRPASRRRSRVTGAPTRRTRSWHAHHASPGQQIMESAPVPAEPRYCHPDSEREGRDRGSGAPPEGPAIPDRLSALVDHARTKHALAYRLTGGPVTEREVCDRHEDLPGALEGQRHEIEARGEPGQPDRELRADGPEDHHDDQVDDEGRAAA